MDEFHLDPSASRAGSPVVRASDAASEATRAAAAVFDCLPDAYLIVNARHEVLLANRRYLELLDVPLEAVLGIRVQDINQFGAQAQRAARREWLDEALRGPLRRESAWSPVFRYEIAGGARRRRARADAALLAHQDHPARFGRPDAGRRDRDPGQRGHRPRGRIRTRPARARQAAFAGAIAPGGGRRGARPVARAAGAVRDRDGLLAGRRLAARSA